MVEEDGVKLGWLMVMAGLGISTLAADDDPFEPLRFLIGSWQGTGGGIGGDSSVTHTFDMVLADKFLRWQTRSVFPPKDHQGTGELHEDIGYFSYDANRKKILLRQFLSEGIVSTYVLENMQKPGELVLHTEQTEGAGELRARIALSLEKEGVYRCILDLAPPGEAFAACRTMVMRKLDPENWLRGLDISHFSGTVDWKRVKAEGHRFVFLKATEGNDWLDPTFKANMAAAAEAGLIRGAYHFFVGHDDPEPQAKNFIDNVQLSPGDLPPVVDIETLSSRPVEDLAARLKVWLEMVEKHYGVKPIIYTSHNFWNAHVETTLDGHPLWVAEYGTDLPRVPMGWEIWQFWQYEGDVDPPGISKMADLNYFNGTEAELKRLLLR